MARPAASDRFVPRTRRATCQGARLPAGLRWGGLIAALCGGLLPCPGCGLRSAGRHGMCAVCRRAGPRPGSTAALAWLGPYGGPLGRAVRALKYRGATRAARWMGVRLAATVRSAGWRPELVCPVPLHVSRLSARGYNQAALVGLALARALGLPFAQALARTRATAPQARLARRARAANVAGAFRADGDAVAGRSVLLVDDVLTTGATAQACRAALLAAGAREVRVVVVARAERAGSQGPPPRFEPQRETTSAVPMPTNAPTSTWG